jgi:hypothetical protein
MAERDDDGDNVSSLAAVASQGLAGETAGALPGMEFATWVKFGGVGYRTNEVEFKIGDKATFLVNVTCVGLGEELMADGHLRQVVKLRTDGVEQQPTE